LLRQPRLLLLDEPTNGLDPAGMRDMRGLIADLASEGLTVLLSSHLMGEVEQLCTELAIIAHGRIRFAGTIAQLRNRDGDSGYRLRVTDRARALSACAEMPTVEVTTARSGELVVRGDADDAAALTVQLGRAGVGIYSMLPDRRSLEELFFELTEGPARVEVPAA
jgi:ABC-2 type transport system ATP-binding protein